MHEYLLQTTLMMGCIINVSSGFQVRYCNRGYCYTKQCDDKIRAGRARRPDHMMLASSLKELRSVAEVPFEICTDSNGKVVDCDLMGIIDGYDGIIGEEEGVVHITNQSSHLSSAKRRKEQQQPLSPSLSVGECAEEADVDVYESKWPHPGHCFESNNGASYDCNLLENLQDGLVLVEDLRVGGFLVLPQSDFSMKRSHRASEYIRAPEVVNGSGASDPTEDWRTMACMALEGI
eukprot:CAMPEP_0196802704 /NCGR_PEP_ID=MMETSP1362-20130617/2274_1 /TAXON_ID=163516 /ORGANISM="Leptocylindrus danicus, Strain CCMP1856" /LENGTH=233 /DNA_ID=CAMNT_0042174071 /DNA_START=187 /DNA_END=888 /DNA_ORIENTATION=-